MEKKKKSLIEAIKEKGETLESEMSFFDHLEVLRWHLIRSAVVIVSLTILSFAFYDYLFDVIIMGPKRPDFWTYQMMCKIGEHFDLGPDFCITNIPGKIINTQLACQFSLQLNSYLLMRFELGFPYLLSEVW